MITVLLVWLVLIPLVLVAANAILLHPRKRPLETRVPQLVGLDRKTANAKAREANVDMKVLLTRWDQPGPTGMILYQVPGVGESVEIGTVVGVTLSIEDPDAKFWKEKEEKVNSGSVRSSERPRTSKFTTKARYLPTPTQADLDTATQSRQ